MAAGRTHRDHGIGGLVVALVPEFGDQGNRIPWDKAAVPFHALIGKHRLVGSDNDIAFPSVLSIDSGIMDGYVLAVDHTRNNAELETVYGRHGL